MTKVTRMRRGGLRPGCIRCGYDLSGLPKAQDQCPECGFPTQERAHLLLKYLGTPRWVQLVRQTARFTAIACASLGLFAISCAFLVSLVTFAGHGTTLVDQLALMAWLGALVFLPVYALTGFLGICTAMVASRYRRGLQLVGSAEPDLLVSMLLAGSLSMFAPTALFVLPLFFMPTDAVFELTLSFALPSASAIMIFPVWRVHRWSVLSARLAKRDQAANHRLRQGYRWNSLAMAIWVALAYAASLAHATDRQLLGRLILDSDLAYALWLIPSAGGFLYAALVIEPCHALWRLHRALSLTQRAPRRTPPARTSPTPPVSP